MPQLEVLVLGGLPIREPLAWAGPFVMNTKAEVLQAFEDFQAGRMGQIPAVHGAPTELQESDNSEAERLSSTRTSAARRSTPALCAPAALGSRERTGPARPARGPPALHIVATSRRGAPSGTGAARVGAADRQYPGRSARRGQLHFRTTWSCGEEQESRLHLHPAVRVVEVCAPGGRRPGVMVALWLPASRRGRSECGEICVAEIVGTDDGRRQRRVGMGITAVHDPHLAEEFSADEYPIDATRAPHLRRAVDRRGGRVPPRRRRSGEADDAVTGLPEAADAGDLSRFPAGWTPGRPGPLRRPLGAATPRQGWCSASWSAARRPGDQLELGPEQRVPRLRR